jgi:DNA primase
MAKYNTSIRPTDKFLQPWIDEFLRKNNATEWKELIPQKRAAFIQRTIPLIKKFLKDSKGYISRQELANLLGVDNDYLRSVSKSAGSNPTGKPNVRYRIFQEILGDVKKLYRPVSGANEGFYKKPTAAAIENFKKTLRSSTILPVMQERINAFVNNKKFMNMLKNDNLTDPDFLDKTKKLFPKLDLTDQKLADGVLYIARGSKGDEFIGTTIKKNLPLHKRLIKQFEESKWGNPFHAAAYKFARTEIDQQLGTKEGTFREYQKKLSQAFKDAGFKNLKNYEVDEIVGASIGGKQQFAPYSVFSRFLI